MGSRGRRLSILAGLVAFAATGTSAQNAADAAAARAFMLHQMALDDAVDKYCFKAPDTDATAMVVKVEDLPASALAPGAGTANILAPVKVGAFTYKGKGIRLSSDDVRFANLRVDPAISTLRLPNGNRLVTANLVHSKGGGECRLALTTSERAAPLPSRMGPLSELAAKAGASAKLAGYRAGQSLPYGKDRFIALMQPESGRGPTLIVTFGGPQNDTRIEAETPLALQGLTLSPPLHIGSWGLGLIGRQPDGSVVQFGLEAAPTF